MKTTLLAGLLAALALTSGTPALAGAWGQGSDLATFDVGPGAGDVFDRRGRGRGRGGREDDDRDGGQGGSRDDDDRGGHGGRPRIPGGSGCDDPGDLLEHPECRLPA